MKKTREQGKFASFFKRKGYLIVLGICIVALGVMIAFIITAQQKPNISVEEPPVTVTPGEPDDPNEPDDPDEPDEPTTTTIVFQLPVKDGVVGMHYCEDELVFSETLGYWFGHMGMDIKGENGAPCMAVYDGEIMSIETDIANGTTITVKHNDDLTTVYSSLSSDVPVEVGAKVKKGDTIGYISDSGYDEYKEGAHVHLEVWEKGEKINPEKYLLTEEK